MLYPTLPYVLPHSSSKKSGRRHAPGSSAVKPKQSSSKEKRKVGAEVARLEAKNAAPTEAEEFPDIETMSRKQEPDGCRWR